MHPILKLALIYGDLVYYYSFFSISPKLLGGGRPPGYGTGRVPRMCVILQLVSATLNPNEMTLAHYLILSAWRFSGT